MAIKNSKTIGHILITGASSGIGAGLAEYYARPDVHLTLIARNQERLEQVAAKAKAKGATVDVHSLDLTKVDDAIALFNKVDEKEPVELLILSAGLADIRPHGAAVERAQDAARMATVNFTCPVALACEAGAKMADRQRGSIVMLGSVASFHDLPLATVYAGSKAGVARFAMALRAALTPKNVNVTLIMPGFIDTPMSQRLDGDQPFLVPVDKAVRLIARSVSKKRAVLVFPWVFQLARFAEAMLPRWLTHRVLRKLDVMQHPVGQ